MKIYRLREAKTSQLKKLLKNGNITEDQFNKADKFFKTYSAFENEIDWNRGLNITWDDLKAVIYKERNSESQTKKKIRKGLEGFEEGKDYLVIEETDSYVAYQPFTWEASRMIASHYVEPYEDKYGYTKDAQWCTAYQKDRTYWDSHNETEAFIYLCGESIPTKKVAVSISKEEEDASGSEFLYSTDTLNFNIWDFDDYNYTIEEDKLLEIVLDLYDLIEKAYKIWKDKKEKELLSKLKLNPQTNKYDYDGDLDRNALNDFFVSEDKDGFTINFGKITGNFYCFELGLTSLKGAPQEVGGRFDCSRNQLTSLEGAPQKVGRDFICKNNYLTSLKGAPQKVGGNFECSWNKLTSLEGAPQTVDGDFVCSYNKLTSLKGVPQIVGRHFSCRGNQLTSLEGAPQTVGWDFSCSNNKLTSLKGAPQKVGGYFYCYSNPNLHSLYGIGEVKGEIVKDF